MYYYRGKALKSLKRTDEAVVAYETYLGFDRIDKSSRAWAHYRLGQIFDEQQRYEDAEQHFNDAVRLSGHKPSKEGLEKIKQGRREGRIP